MIRALILDFDGLILDTEGSLIEAYGDVHAAHGKAFDHAVFARSVGHADYAFDPWRAFGPAADREALDEERRAFGRRRDRLLPILPGVVELLDAAAAGGLRLGIASNSGRPHVEGHLGRLGLLPRFSHVACRGDVPSPKPEPDLYRSVLAAFGLRGSEAIAFEDSHTGALAASRAGLWVVAVPNASTAGHDFRPAHVTAASLADCRLDALLARFGA